MSRTVLAQPRGGPTVLRLVLGGRLRRLRESRSITREDAGFAIRASDSKISRLELGRVGFKERDVADLLSLYGVLEDTERESYLTLVRQTNEPGWWHEYSDVLESWFEMYVGLEEAATRIREYDLQFIPGLLQTPDYARAVFRLGYPDAPEEENERRVSLRMRRQKVLGETDPPHLWVVIDETALRRPLGGPQVMRAQLNHLAEMAAESKVTIQVIPFQDGGHAAAGGAFSILRFAEPGVADVVYLEQLTSAVYLDKSHEVDHYLAVMERLCLEARKPEESAVILQRMAETF